MMRNASRNNGFLYFISCCSQRIATMMIMDMFQAHEYLKCWISIVTYNSQEMLKLQIKEVSHVLAQLMHHTCKIKTNSTFPSEINEK
jgi:hypothetical protein